MGIGDKMAKAGMRKWVLGCSVLALLGCAGLGALVLQVADFPIVAMRAEKVAAEYRAAGLPWESSDMDRGVAPEDNASAEFLAEMETQKSWPPGEITAVQEAMAAYDYHAAAQELELLEPEIAKFEEASRAKAIAFEKDWDLGPVVLFPEYAKVKTAAKLLTWRGEAKAQSGDLTGAFEDLRTAYRIGNMIGKEPTLISMLVGIACQAIAVRGLEHIAALHPDDAAWIAGVRKELATWECTLDFDNAMMGEAYMALGFCRNVPSSKVYTLDVGEYEDYGYPPPSQLVRTGFGKGTVRRAYQTRQMEVALKLNEIKDEPGADPFAMGVAMDEYLENGLNHAKLSNRVAYMMTGIYTQAGMAVAKAHFIDEMTNAVLLAGEKKARTGKFAASWAELGVDPVIDPATKEPMQIRVADGVFLIYSVGLNGEDEGGIRENGEKAGDDFALQFPVKRRKPSTPAGSMAPPPPGAPKTN